VATRPDSHKRHPRSRNPPTGRCRKPLIALVALAGAAAIAACGASSQAGTTSGSSGVGPGIKYADCMRAHGVPNFPDPGGGGGGIQIQAGSGINPFSPSFKVAQGSCAKLLPGGGPGGRHPTAQEIAQTRQVSVCMRQHGVSGFPDPTLTPPSSLAGYSLVMDRGGVVLAVPDTINVQSPAFKSAASACGFGH
jgi:hypothetical protein